MFVDKNFCICYKNVARLTSKVTCLQDNVLTCVFLGSTLACVEGRTNTYLNALC